MKSEKSCGAVIVKEKGRSRRYLLIHQIQGHWCFPKGHIRKGETEEQTAVREIQEETGLKVKITGKYRSTVLYSPSDNRQKEVVYFLAVPEGGREKVQKKELLEMYWVSYAEAMGILTYDSDAAVLEKAQSWLEKRDQNEIGSK